VGVMDKVDASKVEAVKTVPQEAPVVIESDASGLKSKDIPK